MRADSDYSCMRRFDEETKLWSYVIIQWTDRKSNGGKFKMIDGKEFATEAEGESWSKDMLASRPWVEH